MLAVATLRGLLCRPHHSGHEHAADLRPDTQRFLDVTLSEGLWLPYSILAGPRSPSPTIVPPLRGSCPLRSTRTSTHTSLRPRHVDGVTLPSQGTGPSASALTPVCGGLKWMLQPVREYALERLLESGEAEAVRRRHAQHYLTLAQRTESRLVGPGQAATARRLKLEIENLRGALRSLLDFEAGRGSAPCYHARSLLDPPRLYQRRALVAGRSARALSRCGADTRPRSGGVRLYHRGHGRLRPGDGAA